MVRLALAPLCFVVVCAACSENPSGDDIAAVDGGRTADATLDARPNDDAETLDGTEPDATDLDATVVDATDLDATDVDATDLDATDLDATDLDADGTDALDRDAEPADALTGQDAAEPDAMETDAGALDAGDLDATPPDATTPDSGVVGIAALNDEFNDPATLPNWTFRDVAEGTMAQYQTIDIDTTTPGHLTIIPNQTAIWFGTQQSIYLYKMVTGDFVMRTHMRAVQFADPTMPPAFTLNGGGLLARDPASPTSVESWVLNIMGRQQTGLGMRAASTINNNTIQSFDASSVTEADVVLCRVAGTFYCYFRPTNSTLWTLTNFFIRSNMPQTLEVGIATDNDSTQPHLQAEFDWIRFAVPTSQADCTVDIPP